MSEPTLPTGFYLAHWRDCENQYSLIAVGVNPDGSNWVKLPHWGPGKGLIDDFVREKVEKFERLYPESEITADDFTTQM